MRKAMEVEEYKIYMYAFESMVRGYHVYQEMWVVDVGKECPGSGKLRITEIIFLSP